MKHILYDYKKDTFWVKETGEEVKVEYVSTFKFLHQGEVEALKDKLHRRNMQIEDLKKKVEDRETAYRLLGDLSNKQEKRLIELEKKYAYEIEEHNKLIYKYSEKIWKEQGV